MLIVLFCLLCLFTWAGASAGDRSTTYQTCLKQCLTQNCSTHEAISNFTNHQTWYLKALQWDCLSECEHNCMWFTVSVVIVRGYPIPQFHGKWPFVRILGIQEPASVFFSVLNCITHLYMWQRFKKSVPKTAPNYWLWQLQSLLSVNAWIWSAVFHCRDTPFTEKLDYFCAFSLVLCGLYCLSIRLSRSTSLYLSLSIAVPFVSYFLYHVHFLTFVHFDYGYNMRANITVGISSSFGWLLWCYLQRHEKHVFKCAISILAINGLLLLELCDFPPLGYVIDSHSLWHLSTVPMPFLWYRFLIEDSWHLLGSRKYTRKTSHDGLKVL